MTAVWPASGVALGALLLARPPAWPWLLTAIFLANFVANLTAGRAAATAAAFASAITAEALLAATVLVRILGVPVRISSLREVIALVLGAATVSNGATALLGASVPALFFRASYWEVWLVWWIGDGLGMLIVVPLLLTWARLTVPRVPARIVEAVAFVAALVGSSTAILVNNWPAVYLVFPLALWAAFRFGHAGVTLATLVIAGVAVRNTSLGLGPFAHAPSAMHVLLELQAFLVVTTVSALLLAATLHERRQAEEVANRRRRVAESLASAATAVTQSLDVITVAKKIVEQVRELLGTGAAFLTRVEADGGQEVIAVAPPSHEHFYPGLRLTAGVGIAALAIAQRQPVWARDQFEDPRLVFSADLRLRVLAAGHRALLAAPLLVGERVNGVLGVADGTVRDFSTADVAVLEAFAAHAATALHNAQLYSDSQRAYADLANTQHQLLESQKLEAIGRLAGGIAHDFNNLLTVIQGRTRLLLLSRSSSEEPTRRNLELIAATAQRAAALTQQLLAFGRRQILKREIVDLNEVVQGMGDMLRPLLGEDVQLVVLTRPPVARVTVDRSQLTQVIMNLALNARDAMPQGGRLSIETDLVELDAAYCREHAGLEPGRHVRLTVSDTGHGMDSTTARRIFEPFFTTKEVGKGSGLGLSVVHGIIQQSGGAIDVKSSRGEGTIFRVYLPLAGSPGPEPAPLPPALPALGTETVLLVEDEQGVRDFVREVLESHGYRVLSAQDGDEALAIATGHPGPLHLLVADAVMPVMSGRELARHLAPGWPAIKVLYMSGYTDDAMIRYGMSSAAPGFLQKPFSEATLLQTVRAVLEGPGPE